MRSSNFSIPLNLAVGIQTAPGASTVDDVPRETIDALAAQLEAQGFSHHALGSGWPPAFPTRAC